MRFALAWVGVVALAWVTGCTRHQAPPPPLEAPRARLSVAHYVGQPLSGPVVAPIPLIDVAKSLRVEVSLVALETMLAKGGDVLAGRAGIIASLRERKAIAPSGQLMQRVRILERDDPAAYKSELESGRLGRTAGMGTFAAALPPGVTVTFSARDLPAEAGAMGQQARRLEISLYRSPGATGDALLVAVLLSDWVSPPSTRELPRDAASAGAAVPATLPAQAAVIQTETATLARKLTGGGDRFVLLVPLQFSDAQAQALAAIVEVGPLSRDAADMLLVDACMTGLKQTAGSLSSRPSVGQINPPQAEVIAAALGALADGQKPRAALVYLAGESGARVCEDIALASDEAAVQRIASGVVTAAGPARDVAGIGWAMDLACLQHAAKLMEDGKLPPEMAAVLARHTGEVGRHASSLGEALKATASRAEFDRRLTAENLIYLEDSAPSARVRAFDWLASRGQAPAGYDPLASTRERRKALERAATNPTTTGAKAP